MREAPKHSIVITTGMTGGHFFPALSFAESFAAAHPDFEVHFLLPRENKRFDLARVNPKISFHPIPVEPFPRAFSLKLMSFLIHYLRSLRATFQFFSRRKPAVIVSFGSYGSFPGVLCAWVLGIPVVLHEQNRIAGWANRLASFLATYVAVSFSDTSGIVLKGKIKKVGYPLRKEILEAAHRKQSEAANSRPANILVLGGSQGASAINEAVLELFDKLSVEEKQKLAVIHITGEAQHSEVLKRYQANGVKHQVFAFSDEMHRWYEQADLVIARAGAGTVFELIEFNLPSVLIPYPFAHSHQFKNAQYLEEKRMAMIIEQTELTATRLHSAIFEMLKRFDQKDKSPRVMQNPNQNFIQLVDQLI